MKYIAAACGLALTLAGCAPQKIATTGAPPAAYAFTLVDQTGTPVRVAQNPGVPTALYFGFGNCKDVCPQTLALLGRARAMAGLTPANLRIVMVTVDPARDSRKVLAAFIKKTGVQALALGGSLAQLHPVYRSYGVVIEPQRNDLGHTDYVYLIDAHAHLVAIVPARTAVKDVARRLRALVN